MAGQSHSGEAVRIENVAVQIGDKPAKKCLLVARDKGLNDHVIELWDVDGGESGSGELNYLFALFLLLLSALIPNTA